MVARILEHLLDHQQQRGWLYRFCEALFRAALDQRNPEFHRAKPGQHNDGYRGFQLLELWDELKRGAIWKLKIEHRNIRFYGLKTLGSCGERVRLLYQEPVRRQMAGEHAADILVIFDQKDLTADKGCAHSSDSERQLYGRTRRL